MAINKIILNDNIVNLSSFEEDPFVYKGRELEEFSWADLKNKILKQDFSDLRIGDYKTVNLSLGKQIPLSMQIAGINLYGKHIDFVSKKVYQLTGSWSTTNNNGNSGVYNPYLASSIYEWLKLAYQENVFNSDFQEVVSEKGIWAEDRFSYSGTLLNSTGYGGYNLGYYWIPTEFEVFGRATGGTKTFSHIRQLQYPLFFYHKNILKAEYRDSSDEYPVDYALATVSKDSDSETLWVDSATATVISNPVTKSNLYFPICTRILGEEI